MGDLARRIQVLCKQERIPGASRMGYVWAIPADAEKPKDARVKVENTLERLRRDNCD